MNLLFWKYKSTNYLLIYLKIDINQLLNKQLKIIEHTQDKKHLHTGLF